MTAAQPEPSQPVRGGGISRRTKWIIGAVIVFAVLGAIGSTITPSAGPRPAAEATPTAGVTTSVEWGDYNPNLQSRIDDLRDAKDCAGLQTEFDTADANDAATMDRTGHNNANLMEYVDTQLRAAACY